MQKKQSLCLRLETEDVAEATIIDSSMLQKLKESLHLSRGRGNFIIFPSIRQRREKSVPTGILK